MKLNKDKVDALVHRDAVGGMWEEIGNLQFEFLVDQGLLPEMNFLDIGCGSLRGGIHFIRYLNPGGYFGVDANQSLLDAGYSTELSNVKLQHKLPRQNLLFDRDFAFEKFGASFDMALAQSVFSHLPLNHIRLCLIKLSACMRQGGRFFATFFECPAESAIEQPYSHSPGGIISFPAEDPYHYWQSDFQWAVGNLPWEVHYYGDWGHPRSQKIICFLKK